MRSFLATIIALIVPLATANAGSSPVRRSIVELHAAGEHRAAVEEVASRSPAEISLAERLAAAKSAWALGAITRARTLWDEALASADFVGIERSREELARSIMELQERSYNDAVLFAERGARRLEPSELRAQLWMVVGEALKGQGALRQAAEYFTKASVEGQGDTRAEALYQLGEVQARSGLVDSARYSYAGVNTDSRVGSRALRRLINIDVQQRNGEGALTWIGEARANYPEDFSDGWTAHAAVLSLLEVGRVDDAAKELQQLKVKSSETDPWYLLARAAFEAHEIKNEVLKSADVQSSEVLPTERPEILNRPRPRVAAGEMQ